MKISNYTAVLGIAFVLFASNEVMASDQGDLNSCMAAVYAEAASQNLDEATFKVSKISGANRRKITFQTNIDGAKHKVVCIVKRGVVSNVNWPATLVARNSKP